MSVKTVSQAIDDLALKISGSEGDSGEEVRSKVGALKNLYEALGGDKEDIKGTSTVAQMIDEIAKLDLGGGGGDIETVTVHVRGVNIDAQTGAFISRANTVVPVFAVSLETFAPFSEWNFDSDVTDIELPAVNGSATIATQLTEGMIVNAEMASQITDLPEDCIISGVTFGTEFGIPYAVVNDNANILIVFVEGSD